MRTLASMMAAVGGIVAADQVVKAAAIAMLKGRAAVVVIPGCFNLAYVENRGCAWGMLQGRVWPLAAFGMLVLALLVWKRRAVFHADGDRLARAWRWCPWAAETMLYAGILGNLLDRVFRGHVVDMFDFHWGGSHFPCFNVADICICVAAGLLVLMSFLPKSGSRR